MKKPQQQSRINSILNIVGRAEGSPWQNKALNGWFDIRATVITLHLVALYMYTVILQATFQINFLYGIEKLNWDR